MSGFDVKALAKEIWWDEAFTIGDANFVGKIKPDEFAGITIVDAILSKSGADALVDAAQQAKVLIGAGNDGLSPAAREGNINAAWHKLNEALAALALGGESAA